MSKISVEDCIAFMKEWFECPANFGYWSNIFEANNEEWNSTIDKLCIQQKCKDCWKETVKQYMSLRNKENMEN